MKYIFVLLTLASLGACATGTALDTSESKTDPAAVEPETGICVELANRSELSLMAQYFPADMRGAVEICVGEEIIYSLGADSYVAFRATVSEIDTSGDSPEIFVSPTHRHKESMTYWDPADGLCPNGPASFQRYGSDYYAAHSADYRPRLTFPGTYVISSAEATALGCNK